MTADYQAAAVQAVRDHALWFTEDGLASCAACAWTSPDDLAWEAHVVAAAWPHIAAAIADAIADRCLADRHATWLNPTEPGPFLCTDCAVYIGIARSTKPTGETP